MNDIKIEIRRVTEQDLDQLREISISTFTETFAHLNSEDDIQKYMSGAFNAEKLLSEINDPGSGFYFAETGGLVIAYLKVNRGEAQSDLKDENALEIERLYVSAEFKGQGIGRLLFDKAVSLARLHGVSFLWLGVWEHNTDAIAFYKRQGMRPFGSHPFMLGSDRQTDILMKLEP